MKIRDIEQKWSLIEGNKGESYKSIRLSNECVPDLFIGCKNDFHRSLILKLPEGFKINLKSVIKQNLSLTYFKESEWILLTLNDISYLDLFNELILSVYNRIEKIYEADKYTNELIKTFHKWCDLFEESPENHLDERTIMGLFGELRILIDLISPSDSTNINSILEGWRGPYDSNHDFEFDSEDLEVKTCLTTNPFLKIASEYQLDADTGKNLKLIAVRIEQNYLSGDSLSVYLEKIRNITLESQGDFSIILRAIKQKNLSPLNIHEYDSYKYKALSSVYFNCTEPGFPRIVRSEIPDEIGKTKYELCITELSKYIDKIINY
jgi:hypothetical protein